MLLVCQTILDLITTVTFLQFPLQMLNLKKDKPIYKIILTMFVVLTMVISFLSRINEEINRNPFKPIIIFGMLAVLFYVCFSNKISQKTIAYVLFLASMCITEITIMALFTFIGFSLRYDKVANACSNFVAILVLWIFLVICKKLFNKNLKNKNYSSKMWQFDIIIISQLMCSSAIAISVYNNNNFELTSANITLWIFIFGTIICMIIGDIALYKVLLVNSENHELKEALELSNLKNVLELDYYNKLKTNIAETRKINHDISNMVTVMKTLVDGNESTNKEQAKVVIQELTDTLENNKIRKFCENELVNIIIINKYDKIKSNNIEFSCNLNIPNNINIKSTDLCRMFTNIIDNATEACIAAKDKTKAFIILSAQIKSNNFVVKCINYCDTNIPKDTENLTSTKPNHHGLGIEILKNIAKSYSGDVTISCKDNTFTIVTLLKI